MDGIEWQEVANSIIRIGIAAVLGGVIGFERGRKGRPAGLRTHMMVSMGCAIFVIVGLEAAGEERESVTRVIQGLASGIGFLGAGTILKLDEKEEIKGLTTASSIWLAAALGTTAGLAQYVLAAVAAIISLFVLAVLGPLENYLELKPANGDHNGSGGKRRRHRPSDDKAKGDNDSA